MNYFQWIIKIKIKTIINNKIFINKQIHINKISHNDMKINCQEPNQFN